MKKFYFILIFLLGVVSFSYAQKWEVGVNAGLFRNGSINTADGAGGNFAGTWNISSSFYQITNYKVGFFVRRHISKFFVNSGASINFNQQMDVMFENINVDDPNYGEGFTNGYSLQTISVPLTGGIYIYKGFGFETGFILEFDIVNHKNYRTDPEIQQYANAINQAFNKRYWRYTAGLFYQYKRFRASVDFLYDLGWIIPKIPYSYNDHNDVVHSATWLFEKSYSVAFSLSYSIFSK